MRGRRGIQLPIVTPAFIVILVALAPLEAAAVDLRAGASSEHSLAPGEAHDYTAPLEKGDFLSLLVRRKGVAVTIALTSPSGSKVGSTGAPSARYGLERLIYTADDPGVYVLRISGGEAGAPPGRYELQVVRMGPASDRDRSQLAAEALVQEAVRLQEAHKWNDAADRLTKAVEIQRAIDDRLGEANALSSLGDAVTQSGRTRDALAHFTRSAELFHELEDPYNEAAGFFNRGVNELKLGDKSGALSSIQEAMSRFEATASRSEQAMCLHQIGQIYWAMGERQKVLDYFLKSLEIHRTSGNKAGEARTLNSIGAFYYNVNDNDRALEYFRRALALSRKLGQTGQTAVSLFSIGERFRFAGEYAKSRTALEEALPLARASGDRDTEARILSSLGTIYAASGDTPRALDILNQATDIAGARQDTAAEADALSKSGTLLGTIDRNAEALEKLNRAVSLDRDRGYAPGEAQSLFRIASIERKTLRLAEARAHLEQAMSIVEGVWSHIASPEWSAQYLGSKKEFYDLYVDTLMAMHQQHPANGFDSAAFAAAERSRARSLLDVLAQAKADLQRDLDPQLVENEAILRKELGKAVQAQTVAAKQTRAQREQAAREIARLVEQYEIVEARLRESSSRYASVARPEPATVAQIQAELDADSVLLEYSLGQHQSYVWAVTRDGLSSFALPPAGRIETVARAAYGQLQQDVAASPAVGELSRMLLEPVRPNLDRKRIVVVPDGILQYIPFSTLTNPARPNTPLLVHHELVNLPSAASLAVLRRESPRRQGLKQLAVFADPVFDSQDSRVSHPPALRSADPKDLGLNLRRLPFTRLEAQSITEKSPPAERMSALDFEASRELFLSGETGRYRVLHLATHAVLNSEHPELSGVALSMVDKTGAPRDGFVRLVDIYHLRLGAELVVLSACETALGKEIRGEGLIGLTRGFMYAGAPRVVSTLWKVDDRATAELMRNFYDGMFGPGKLRPAAALRAAQLALSKQPRWRSPYFWGAFVLQGEWR